MAITLYGHPFSSYCQKVLIPLFENGTPYELKMLAPGYDANAAEHAALWPLKKMPVLVEDGRTLVEASIIVEYLDVHHRGPVRMIPDEPDAALDVRMLDRFFDNYVATPMQTIVFDAIRPAESRDPYGVAAARTVLETSYRWLDDRMQDREWAAGGFSLADCAAAPSLFYADWTHEIGEEFAHVRAYRRRLLARPSVARAVDGGRPYRAFFPLGAPDRD